MTPDDKETAIGPLVVEVRAQVAVIRLNRPDERNALSVATLQALNTTVSSFIPRQDVQAIIFTGTDDVFAAGADIRELRALTHATAVQFAERGQRLMQSIAEMPQLTIAAVNGYCMGGGLDLALSCKLRVASTGAVFAHPGARLGIITGWGGTQRLPRLIGTSRALEMFATARRVQSDEALRIGLVNRVCDDALDGALELARTCVLDKAREAH